MSDRTWKANMLPYYTKIIMGIRKHPKYPLNLLALFFLFGLFCLSLVPELGNYSFFLKTRNTFLISGILAFLVSLFFFILALFPPVNLSPFWAGLPPIILGLILLSWGYPFLPALALGSIGYGGLEIFPRLSRNLEELNQTTPLLTGRIIGLPESFNFFHLTLPVLFIPLCKSFLKMFLCILTVETTINFLGLTQNYYSTWGTALRQAYLEPGWPHNWTSYLWPGLLFLFTSLSCSILIEGRKK